MFFQTLDLQFLFKKNNIKLLSLYKVCILSNREISFIVPNELRDVRGWSMLNMQKIDNKIIGLCPEWVITGNQAIGGFCASFNFGKNIIINNGYFFENNN